MSKKGNGPASGLIFKVTKQEALQRALSLTIPGDRVILANELVSLNGYKQMIKPGVVVVTCSTPPVLKKWIREKAKQGNVVGARKYVPKCPFPPLTEEEK